ncbi:MULTISPECIES: superinfection immunity protein [Shewanella]|uniref:Superinfection immunity protein n=1 Tax=Shewanella morhuae TaxID=365591 RepID=A0A380B2G1_9GAMM|nr:MULTISPECIES: superinfection immunity protein [Shewanella]SUI90884.1 Uncharacterised protein [Shewanella morhuae]
MGGVSIFQILLLCVYLLPTFLAVLKKHADSTAITVLNIFLGWTFIGWVVALVWVVKKPKV